MRIRPLYLWVIAMTVSGLALPTASFSQSALHPRYILVLQNKQGGKVSKSSNVWVDEKTIQRPQKVRVPRRQRIIRAPLLTLEYRIFKQSKDGTAIETSPSAIFQNEDALQLRIKVNQDGYLHIIQNRDGADGEILFPDSRINNGNNFVRKNQEIIIPSNCPPGSRHLDEQGNCWFNVEGLAGSEIFTLIFSREAVPEVINRIATAGGSVRQQDIRRIQESANQVTSRPNLSPQQGGGAGRYAQWVTNNNRNNNEELVKRIVLNHK